MFFLYKVRYWSDYDDEEKEARGLTYGKDYGEAANKVYEDYKDDVIDIYLQALEEENTLTEDDITTIIECSR